MASILASYAYSGISYSAQFVTENILSPAVSCAASAATYAYDCAASAAKSVGLQLAGRALPLIGDLAAYLTAGKANQIFQKKIADIDFPGASATKYAHKSIGEQKKISKTGKSLMKLAATPLIRGLGWIREPSSFNSLMTSAGSSLANYMQTLRDETVLQSGNELTQAHQSGDKESIKQARRAYRKAIAQSLGYKGLKDLKKQTISAVRSKAGHFVTNNGTKSSFHTITKLFKSAYRTIIGRVVSLIVKKRVAKISEELTHLDQTLGHFSPYITQEERETLAYLIKAQAEVFALHTLHSLMQQHDEIKKGNLPPEGVNASLQKSLSSTVERTSQLFFSESLLQKEGIRLAKRVSNEIDFETALGTLHKKLVKWL